MAKTEQIVHHIWKMMQDRGKLLLTDKSHMGFPLALKLLLLLLLLLQNLYSANWLLNDLERCNGHYFCIISPHSVALEANYITVLEVRSTLS